MSKSTSVEEIGEKIMLSDDTIVEKFVEEIGEEKTVEEETKMLTNYTIVETDSDLCNSVFVEKWNIELLLKLLYADLDTDDGTVLNSYKLTWKDAPYAGER